MSLSKRLTHIRLLFKKNMKNNTKSFDNFFESEDLIEKPSFSEFVISSIVRSLLEPIAKFDSKAIIFTRLKNLKEVQGIIKRLEYSKNVTLKEFSDFEFSKYDVKETGFVILTSQRYNASFIYNQIEENKYQIYFKVNSKLVSDAYEKLKSIFHINYDEEFYQYRPERRDNDLMNEAVVNIIKYFEEITQEKECLFRIQENYKNVNETNTTLRNEIYQNARQIAHEIKNQLSILDIYTRIFEKKTNDTSVVEPIKKSIGLIKSQLEQFKNMDMINLQEEDVKDVIKEAIKMYNGVLAQKNNKIIFIDEIPYLETNAFIDSEKFLIVIGNVIKNANDSTQNDEIIIKLNKVDEKIKISIINHGEMIKDEDKPKIFESGYSTKKDGWGVGLAVCQKYIGSQFGTFELTKSEENETIFSIFLPLIQTK